MAYFITMDALKSQLFVKHGCNRINSKKTEYTKMKPCPLNDGVHQQSRAAFPAISLTDVQVPDSSGTCIFDIGVTVKTTYSD